MKDNQTLMIEFVKIVRRYPEIYDASLDTYRTRFTEAAWAKIANHVKTEMNEECTVEELKIKWKGIRSSFSRYKSKLNPLNNENTCKKYYLYDHLRFLEPFLKNKGPSTDDEDKSEGTINDACNYVNIASMEVGHEYPVDEWNHIEIKPESRLEILHRPEALQSSRSSTSETYIDKAKKRKYSLEGTAEEDSEDLSFFKSILPDIRNFTIKEKRKLKMGILHLIDEIEKDRET